ncbi:hypothetical protein [Pyruvatibacter sp.]|uniref:hypothetical protein n=1 Tax=Pyruvatibacter sp. TaxID=1981328 RepID=UPI0032EF6539
MTKKPARLRLAAALAAIAAMFGAPAANAFTGIEPFLGQWLGEGVTASTGAMENVDFRGTDLDVQIYPKGATGFIVSQREVLWSAGEEEQHSMTLVFDPTDQPGVFEAQTDCNPVSTVGCAWARIAGDTLTITMLSFQRADEANYRVYKRTLTDNGLELAYSHVVDDKVAESFEGFAIRQIN